MNKPALIATLLLDRLSRTQLPREPEQDLVMDDPEQVAAYEEAGRIDGLMASAYLFHSARVSQTIVGCSTVIDLACGPAVQLCQIAKLNPGTQFLGIDLSPTMLDSARQQARAEGLDNVSFQLGDISDLSSLKSASVDGVISTMALHHLPTVEHLQRCFQEVDRVLQPDGAIYLADFARLNRPETVDFFVRQDADRQPRLFALDYQRSLRAAFTRAELEAAAFQALRGRAKVHSTFMVPMLTVIKTPDRPLPPDLRDALRDAARGLQARDRSDLGDLRTFFFLGGLRNDPFR